MAILPSGMKIERLERRGMPDDSPVKQIAERYACADSLRSTQGAAVGLARWRRKKPEVHAGIRQ